MSEATFQRYPEKRLQLAAIDWLKRARGYKEVYSDEEATGARVDSIGLLAGQLVLIEVKTSVTPPLVDHRPDRAHSIAGFQYETILVPRLIGRTARAKSKTVAELLTDAAERQCDTLLAHLVSSARDSGFLIESGRTSVGFRIRLPGWPKRALVMGAYLDGSSAAGLNVGWWNEGLDLDIARLPGLPLQNKAGFLNSNRLLRNTAEVDRMLAEVLAASRTSRSARAT